MPLPRARITVAGNSLTQMNKKTKEALEKRILRLSFFGSCALSAAEVLMAFYLQSYTVLMDAVFDSAELVMMWPFLLLIPLLYKPVSEWHPYGYAQVESLFLIVKYSILLVLILLMINTNVHVILSGGHDVSPIGIAIFEICLGIGSVLMYLFLQHMSRKYESPTIHAELFLWKTDIVGSCGIAIAFLADHLLGDTILAPVAPYMDSAVAIILSLIMLGEPLKELNRGFKQMLLFSPPKEVMDKVHEAVDKHLEDMPYEATFIDVIQTGRKTWIEVYLKETSNTSLIDTRDWSKLHDLVRQDLRPDFDQLYIEFIPDLHD